ncbi:MAG TPA: DUF3048 domain-containing protein [Acidimicrobiales bacterium]|nr:DUF3048 domain-containing protein [Acidimicrobiales bacterium]
MKRLLAGLAAASLLVAGCSSKDDGSDKKTPTTGKASGTTMPVAVAADVFPLTGMLVGDAATRNRPALVVKIDNNSDKSYPQYGIGAADIVVVEGVEGGITRLAVIFHSKDSATVGPVRSARSSDLHIAQPLGEALFAYSGTNGNFQELIEASPLIDLSPKKLPGAYHRDPSRPAVYNLFSGTPQLFKAARAGATGPKPLLRFAAQTTAATGVPVTKLDMHWKMPDRPTRTDATWTWAGPTPSRVQNGKATTDATGEAIAPRNIVLLFVEYPDTGERDQSKSIVPEAKLEGVGEAWVIRDGMLTRGTWTKPGNDSPIAIADGEGKAIELLPGQTWIELPEPGNATVG